MENYYKFMGKLQNPDPRGPMFCKTRTCRSFCKTRTCGQYCETRTRGIFRTRTPDICKTRSPVRKV